METQQNQPADISTPEFQQNADQSQSEGKHVIFGLTVGLILVVGVLGYMFLSGKGRRARVLPVNVSSPPKVSQTAPVSTKLISTPSSKLSKDDSLNTLKKELKDTSVDDFSSDLQGVKNDINGL